MSDRVPTRLLVSFSGGETSGLMSKLAKECAHKRYDEIRFAFANTGQENEETLVFADQCDKAFGLDLVWIEAVITPARGVGIRHNVVDFATASREGQPFEALIQKYGIPNKASPHCTRDLKSRSILSWAKSIGWNTGSYDLAIGIRADEIDRMSPHAGRDNIVYPLISWLPRRKEDVNEFWRSMPFRLNLKGYQGNCKWCWKKSLRKHLTIISEAPEKYDFPESMEARYPLAGPNPNKMPRVFFREERSTLDLRRLAAETDFEPASDDAQTYSGESTNWLDADLGECGSESCEVDFSELTGASESEAA